MPTEPLFSRGLRCDRLGSRRNFLIRSSFAAGGIAAASGLPLLADALPTLDVAYAGSMGSLMDGPIKSAAAGSLKLEIHGRGQGANALANLIVGGSIMPDVFIPITPGPMRTVLQAGKATLAEPIARTEMVIAYNPKSRFAGWLDAAAKGHEPWWKVLQEPGFRFGRSDPSTDPQGRNIIFTMMLAAKIYAQPDLVGKVLGPTFNKQQINAEANLQSHLQSGNFDAVSAYKVQPATFHLPSIALPAAVNLSGEDVHAKNPDIQLLIGGKTYVPEPLIYYAATLHAASNAPGAAAFVQWLTSAEAQALFRQGGYDPPGNATVLRV